VTTCKIIISDETNCKITNLDLSTRKKLVNTFKYDIPGARYTPAVKLGRWDGKKAFCQLGGSTYINLLPEILPILDSEGYNIELEDLRDYNNQFEFEEVVEDSYSHIVWPKGHRFEGKPIELRDDQVEAINTFLRDTQSIQCLATGFGKTILTAVLSHKCEPYGRTVVVVPSKDLVLQTEEDYLNMGLDVGVFFGTRKEYNKTHTICTWQSLNSMFKKTKAGEAVVEFGDFIDGVCCIMIDEAHGLKADALLTMMTSVMSRIPIRWGITGTIPKEDFEKRSLQVSIGDVVGTVKASDLQEKGILSNCHVNIVQMIDHVEYKQYQDELKYLLETEGRLNYMASLIQQISTTGNTLVLIDRVDPGQALVNCIPGAVFLSGATKSGKRKDQYDSIAVNDNGVTICTYGIAAVGINVPRIFNLVLIEPGKSFVRVIQSIGRGIRKAEDKDFVNIYDVTSTCKFAKRHLTKRKQFYTEANYPYAIEKVDWQSTITPKGTK
jgi:superfamily II DNA or RNA helicase